MTNNDVNKVKRKGTFKSAPLPEKVLAAEPPKGDELVKIAVAALEDVKAQDVLVIDVRDKALGIKPLGEEGKGDSDWVLLDMDDVIVHMMTSNARQFYDLERLWKGAEQSRAADGKHHSPEVGHEHFTKLNKDQE
jgi:ribosome-associated protein